MSLVQDIKKASLEARKARDKVKSDLLTTLLSDIQMIGKNDGNREPTDGDAIVTIKKYIKNINDTIAAYGHALNESATNAVRVHDQERALLLTFLPSELTSAELTSIVQQIISDVGATSMKDMGRVMKVLKERYNGLYDGAEASKIVKSMF
jgi:uncharacterized protein YqeY